MLFTASLETYVGRAKTRAKQIASIIEGAPDWKKDLAHDGEVAILVYEGIDFGNVDWTNDPGSYVPEKYDAAWDQFVTCLDKASERSVGDICLRELKRNIVVL